MDDRQKSNIQELANKLIYDVNPEELADLLLEANLIKSERKEQIFNGYSSPFTKNLQLFGEAIESSSTKAYTDLLHIAEKLDLDTFSRSRAALALKSKKEGPTGLTSVCNHYINKSPNFYPIGMKSGSISRTQTPSSQCSTSGSASSNNGSKVLSPLKEKHRATLISGGRMVANEDDGDGDSGDLTYRISTSQINSPNTRPSFTSPPNRNVGNELNPLTRSKSVSKCSQTPNRQRELASFRSLSLADEDSDDEEPIISWHPYESPPNESILRPNSPHHHCLCSYSSASSESGESTTESQFVEQNLNLDPNVMTAIAQGALPTSTNMMSVTLATQCHNHPEYDYKMTSNPRGICLIVNNIDFEAEMFPTRKGSDEDANRFDLIFKQLGFITTMTRNLTADEIRNKFKELSKACKPEHDALFVFIFSHGSEHGIYGTDGIEVHLDSEIITLFDNRNCKAMIGKPKVFVIQACRGHRQDCGGDGDATDSIAWPPPSVTSSDAQVTGGSQENRVPPSWLPSAKSSDGKKRKYPIRTDMLLIYSCLAGFVSVRNETAGSWLGVALAYFIMTHAHERDLQKILNLVAGDINQRESTNGHIQSIETKFFGWSKSLYFNPGIYENQLL